MRYVLLLYGEETWLERLSDDERAAHMQRWGEYDREMRAAGVGVAGDALLPTPSARTVRGSGAPMVSDGPFAETREQLGGFIEIDVPSLDDAVAWAERCPVLVHGAVEVRPVAAM